MSNHDAEIIDGNLDSSILRSIECLKNDQLIGMPTETVYGLAALASSTPGVKKIFEVKQRPTSHPLILHLAGFEELDKWAIEIPEYAKDLGKHFWPGPLTIILQRSNLVCDEITGGRNTVAIRVPNHSVALRLLSKLNDGLVAPSANRFGKVSPTSAHHVVADLGSDIALVLDGGHCAVGIESTILDCTRAQIQILRAGAITKNEIEEIAKLNVDESDGEARASGMLEKHYAPNCKVVVAENSAQAVTRQIELENAGVRAAVLDFCDNINLYAKQLYAELRLADANDIAVVVAVLPAGNGLAEAIRDRLTKAAASNQS